MFYYKNIYFKHGLINKENNNMCCVLKHNLKPEHSIIVHHYDSKALVIQRNALQLLNNTNKNIVPQITVNLIRKAQL